jgi:hypothetical protein
VTTCRENIMISTCLWQRYRDHYHNIYNTKKILKWINLKTQNHVPEKSVKKFMCSYKNMLKFLQ